VHANYAIWGGYSGGLEMIFSSGSGQA